MGACDCDCYNDLMGGFYNEDHYVIMMNQYIYRQVLV